MALVCRYFARRAYDYNLAARKAATKVVEADAEASNEDEADAPKPKEVEVVKV